MERLPGYLSRMVTQSSTTGSGAERWLVVTSSTRKRCPPGVGDSHGRYQGPDPSPPGRALRGEDLGGSGIACDGHPQLAASRRLRSFSRHQRKTSRTAGGTAARSGSRLMTAPRTSTASIPPKWLLAGQQFVRDDAEGPDIGSLVGRLPLRLLGRHVGCSAESAAKRMIPDDFITVAGYILRSV